MEGTLFFVDKGNHVTARNSKGTMVTFDSLEQFDRYYSGDLDLSGEYYIDYEPEKKLLYKSEKGNFDPLSNQWTGPIPGYEDVIDDVENIRKKLNDPYFGLTVEECREYKLNHIKRFTYAAITRHMPEWKQIKHNEFIRIYQKKESGASLTKPEKVFYDSFPNEPETHESCYNQCLASAEWIMNCIALNDRAEKIIKKARSAKTIKAVKEPEYPSWEQKDG